MKVCKSCDIEKPLTEFYTYKHGDRITYYARCKDCQKAKLKEEVGQPIKNAQRRKRANRSQEAVNAAKSVPCADCKIQYPTYVMDLDHVRGVKVLAVAAMIAKDYPLKDILAEIEKCEVVCSNCHRIRTHKRKQNV